MMFFPLGLLPAVRRDRNVIPSHRELQVQVSKQFSLSMKTLLTSPQFRTSKARIGLVKTFSQSQLEMPI